MGVKLGPLFYHSMNEMFECLLQSVSAILSYIFQYLSTKEVLEMVLGYYSNYYLSEPEHRAVNALQIDPWV